MKIGCYDVELLNLGSLLIDGGAMFGVIPKTIWEKNYPADEKNRISMTMKSLLLISDDRIILIDTGTGNKYPAKVIDSYHLDDSFELLKNELGRFKITPDDVTDVIFTHLHFDHSGGATYYDNGELKITFPNANYYVQKSQFEWAQNPSVRDRAGFYPQNFIPLVESEKLVLLDGDVDLFPDFSVYKVNGHTYGMQLAGIYDEHIKLLYVSDLIPLANHVQLPYITSFDLLPMITLEEKKLFLEECYKNNAFLFLQHDSNCDMLKIDKTEKGFVVKERLKWGDLDERVYQNS